MYIDLTTTEIEQKVPSCKINKTTIKKIIELVETEINKIPQENKKYSTPDLDVRIESGKRKTTIHNSTEFELQEIPHDLKSIRVYFRWYHEPEMEIDIDLGFQWWNTSTIEISSTDTIWINGVLGQINDILTQNPTKHDILHNNSTKIPIFLAIAILIGFGIYFIIPVETLSDEEGFTFVYGIPLLSITSAFSILMFSLIFIPWLFPLIEFEERSTQRKIRKTVLISFATIILGIIATGLYTYFSTFNPD